MNETTLGAAAALRRYGWHDIGCPRRRSQLYVPLTGECNCGLDAAIGRATAERPEDVAEIAALCEARHPHSPDEDVAWLAVHRLLRERTSFVPTDHPPVALDTFREADKSLDYQRGFQDAIQNAWPDIDEPASAPSKYEHVFPYAELVAAINAARLPRCVFCGYMAGEFDPGCPGVNAGG